VAQEKVSQPLQASVYLELENKKVHEEGRLALPG
jgi:hypothetical protein